jgi:hypothetical protein
MYVPLVTGSESPSAGRVLAGLLIAPAVPALLMYLGQAIVGGPGTYQMALFILMFGYPLSLIVGLPAYLVLRSKHVHRAQPFVYVGAAIGLMGYGLFFALTASNSVYTNDLRLALLKNTYALGVLGLGCGAISGLVFWHVAIKSRE